RTAISNKHDQSHNEVSSRPFTLTLAANHTRKLITCLHLHAKQRASINPLLHKLLIQDARKELFCRCSERSEISKNKSCRATNSSTLKQKHAAAKSITYTRTKTPPTKR